MNGIIDARGRYDVAVARASLSVEGRHLCDRLWEIVTEIIWRREP